MNTNDGLMYKATAFAIFVVLVVLIVLISVSTVQSREDDAGYMPDKETVADTTGDTTPAPPVTTSAPETTAKVPDTTAKAPDTTASTEPPAVVGDPVSAPSFNISEDYAEFLAKFPDTVLAITEDAGQAYIDKMVFLGDSTTYGLRAYSMLSGGKDTLQVWTPKSGTLTLSRVSFDTIVYPETGAEITIKDAVTAKQPEYLVITLGVNGVSFMGEEYFKSEYKKLLESVKEASPDTKIICQSMFPVARTYEYLGSIDNTKIAAANRWIVEVAAECGVKFIDTYSVLADAEGWLPEEYHNGDGMHLNADSFTLELNNLRTRAYPDTDEK
ncbi:MAG: hypothetical protein E7632_00645 [Ruminococcaceae bacterium]|nr:hypothetical protein [Oscillospiraceae bacterium]